MDWPKAKLAAEVKRLREIIFATAEEMQHE
jgi:hypothetical protein